MSITPLSGLYSRAMAPDGDSPLALDPETMRRLGYRTIDMLVDRIAGLTDWTVQQISATPELRAQVQTALDQAYDDYYAGRLAPVPQDTSSAS